MTDPLTTGPSTGQGTGLGSPAGGAGGTGTALEPAALRARFDPAGFTFATTAELEPLPGLLGQERAMEAIGLAARIRHPGFNLFVLGPEGTGRSSAVRRAFEEAAARRPVPPDWVYVQNFETPEKPRALALPPGTAQPLKAALAELVDDLANDIPALFESDEYQNRRRAIEQDFGSRNEAAFQELAERARERSVAILRTPMGFAIAPVRDGEVIKPDVFARFPEAERREIEARVKQTEAELEEVLKAIPQIEKEHRRAIAALNAEMAEQALDASLGEVTARFGHIPAVAGYLSALRADLVANAELFLAAGKREGDGPFPVPVTRHHADPRFHRYAVNVMVAHPGPLAAGAPVVTEPMPTLANLVGRVEYVAQMGTLVTDFTLIRPGALHRANGGFLVLDARRLLAEPFAWEALKRCLESSEIRIISPVERMGLAMTTTLEPDPIPLDIRVVIVGDRLLHMLLSAWDPDFPGLFKLAADFGPDTPRTPESAQLFARLVAGVIRREHLRPATADGVAALIDEASRQAEDREKLSLRIEALWDILREADHLAGEAGRDAITAADVTAAVAAAERRAGGPRERVHEAIARGSLIISTRGSAVGQVNGLTVADLGTTRFGAPVRITARVRMGSGRVVDIEREVKLGGPIHSKGVLILSSFLATRYAPEMPLSLWASLVFEQSYGGVEGDSASVAELCALISALAEVPLSQSYAVTGSVNQMGEVQPVGGVNEKIEGFFDVCRAQGLTGRQGVLIPRRNVANLMLRPDVVAAVAEGSFAIHALDRVDQAVELLTGLPAGERGPDGLFPAGSVNAAVEARLVDYAETLRAFASRGGAREAEAGG